ncbi:MAG: alpha-1,4-glucan--maltose-1-phosphate maltosyltransferase [Brevundimonas sp.]
MPLTGPGACPRACIIDAASLEPGRLDARLGEIAGLGFDSVVVRLDSHVYSGVPGSPDAAPEGLRDAARRAGLAVTAELPPLLLDEDHPLARAEPGAFLPNPAAGRAGPADPRRPETLHDGCLRLARAEPGPGVTDWLAALLGRLSAWFDRVSPPPGDPALGRLLTALQDGDPAASHPAGADTLPRLTLDGGALPAADRRAALASVALDGRGWIMEAGYEDGVAEAVRATNDLLRSAGAGAPVRRLTGPAAPLDVRLARRGETGLLLVRNRTGEVQPCTIETLPTAGLTALSPIAGFDGDEAGTIGARQVRLFEARPSAPVRPKRNRTAQDLKAATAASARVVVDNLDPAVDQGAWAVKRVIGDTLAVQADVITDGHEQLAAALLVKADDEPDWRRYPMLALPNDRFGGAAPLLRLGRHAYVIEAWIDEWGGFVRDLRKKLDAGLDVALEVREGRALMEGAGPGLKPFLAQLDATEDADGRAALLLRDDLGEAMAAAVTPRFLTRSHVQPVEVEREAARFSSWYELFPRSQTDDKARPGTLLDVIGALPRVRAMGFDTLYFTPIHPIGRRNRKGPNNTLAPGPDDVGSPYAIGAAEGGHTAVHPELGTLEDFRTLVAAAADHGLEIALDFAIQCAPDHPWLTEHPGWFAWRPDGSMKYAENPPKKYQDIVNVDFYAADAIPGLWQALRDVVLFWAGEGVRTFRVDNPHTKPLPFWRWMIAEVKAVHPDVLFLSEAFTRPKPMYQLAKVGFSQSYTYFTWRNTKAELTEYLTELNGPVREFFRPHFFVNTPDINPYFLQSGTRAAFLIRAALGATLSGLFGVYAGFELCEFEALPGREEYLDSEKYEVRVRPHRRPGDIVDEITALNALRREHPHLQSHLGITFHNAFNDQVLYFSKTAPGHDDRILVAVNLDPHHPQAADFEVPLWEFGLGDGDSVAVEDLLEGHAFRWAGKIQHLRLTPERPYAIWRISKS